VVEGDIGRSGCAYSPAFGRAERIWPA